MPVDHADCFYILHYGFSFVIADGLLINILNYNWIFDVLMAFKHTFINIDRINEFSIGYDFEYRLMMINKCGLLI